MYDAYWADLQTQEVGGNPGRVDSRVKKMKTTVVIISDQVTPIHLCETLELVNKKTCTRISVVF
jgi:hypothetical protein